MKKIHDTLKSPTAYKIFIDADQTFNKELLRKLTLFQLINEYWKQILIPQTFGLSVFIYKYRIKLLISPEAYTSQFKMITETIYFSYDEKDPQSASKVQKGFL